MRLLKQSDTSKAVMFLMVSSTDHVTAVTGLSPTVTISKNGGAFGSPTGTVAEVSSGWYKLTPSAADVGTLGPLCIHVTGTGADPVDLQYQVVAFDPYDAVRYGLTALPNAAAGATGALLPAVLYAGTTHAASTSTRIRFNGTSGTLPLSGLAGRIVVVGSGYASQARVISAGSTGDGTDYVDVTTAFTISTTGEAFQILEALTPNLDSSARVDVGKIAGQTASATGTVDFDGIGTIVTNVASILGKFTGITLLAKWLQTLSRSSTPDATALSEINSGGGTFSATTDSLQAIKDSGVEVDEAAVAAAVWSNATRTLTSRMQATVDSPFIASKDLPATPVGSGPQFQWEIFDSSGNAVNLSGKTVRFVVATVDEGSDEFSKYDDTLTGAFQYQSGTSALAVSGTSSNVVTVQVDSADIDTAGVHRYWIWDATTSGAERVLVKGKFPVEPAVRSV